MKKRTLTIILALCLTLALATQALAAMEVEPNDSSAAAQTITIGDSISGEIKEGGDEDFYAFTLTETGKVSLDVTAYMAYYSMLLFNEEGTRLWSEQQKEWNAEVGFRHDEYDVYLAAGTYYLQVKGSYYASGESNAPGSYTIKTEFTSANVTESEPNDSVAKANKVNVGNVICGVVATGNVDTDFYAFTLTESGKVSLDVTAYMAYYSMLLFNEEGTRLWSEQQKEWNAETGFRHDEYDVHLAAGTYYLQVKGSYYTSGESNAPGFYTIKLGDIINVTSITMQQTSLSMDPGQTATLSATVYPSNATERAIVWSSSNSNVATVDQSGMVTVIAEGTATITATTADGGYTAQCVVTSPKAAITFTDIPADSPYAPAVTWAVEKGVTNGTSVNTFSPDATCTRGQIITFLWRAAGQPEPTITNINFDDVSPDAYYAKAIRWASRRGSLTVPASIRSHRTPPATADRSLPSFGAPPVSRNRRSPVPNLMT